jgi:hypothetical protein
MDPYLEDPAIWSGVHASLLGAIQEQLGPALRPKYVVRYEERVYVTGEDDPGFGVLIPDMRIIERDRSARNQSSSTSAVATPITVELVDPEIHEGSLIVRDVRDRSIVTVIELLSPTNKTLNSVGRASFLKKRSEILATDAHWIEMDLLREGARTANLPRIHDCEYQVYLSRATDRRRAQIWPISLRDRLPAISIPLRTTDPDATLDLQTALNAAIERGSYDLDTDYSKDPVPPLTAEQSAWVKQVLIHK